jgi:D-lactate dehydrogenase
MDILKHKEQGHDMKIAFYSTHGFEKKYFVQANSQYGFEIDYFEAELNLQTINLLNQHQVLCAFVNDQLSPEVVEALATKGIQLIALRSAGFNHVHLKTCQKNNIKVVRVPEYSPYAVAEHAVALLMTLNRKLHRAYNRVREGNFNLDGLVGFDLHGKTVGVIGVGKIGAVFCNIMRGFGCHVYAHDLHADDKLLAAGVKFCDLNELLKKSDIVSLHVPLVPSTRHMINQQTLSQMKAGVIIINTSRGGLIDTKALINGLKTGAIGGACLDVYEEEEGMFFHDLSESIIQDDVITRLMTFPNVLITSHQAFLTAEALGNIADTTLINIHQFQQKLKLSNEVVE